MLAGTDSGTGVRGHVGVWGGICCSALGGSGGERRDTHRNTHTHTQERTRECCTCPLATCPLKSARMFAEDISEDFSLVDVSDIFYFFSAWGRGRGSPGRQGRGGGRFFVENHRRGGGLPRGGGGGGAGRVSAGNGGGRGATFFFFFSGPKCPPSLRRG